MPHASVYWFVLRVVVRVHDHQHIVHCVRCCVSQTQRGFRGNVSSASGAREACLAPPLLQLLLASGQPLLQLPFPLQAGLLALQDLANCRRRRQLCLWCRTNTRDYRTCRNPRQGEFISSESTSGTAVGAQLALSRCAAKCADPLQCVSVSRTVNHHDLSCRCPSPGHARFCTVCQTLIRAG